MSAKRFVGHEIKPLPGAGLVTKLGGMPSGFDFDAWPNCRMCGVRQKFLFQLDLQSPAPLTQKHRWAFVFACDDVGQCDPFLEDSGANAVILVTEAEANARANERTPPGIVASQDERHLAFQPATEEWLGAPEIFLGFAPGYHFPEVIPCPRCEGEMTVISQVEYDGSASFITLCNAECSPDAACFMW